MVLLVSVSGTGLAIKLRFLFPEDTDPL